MTMFGMLRASTITNGTLFFILLISAPPAKLRAAETSDIRVPDGFEVIEHAGDDLAHDIYSMTIDTMGRVVVSGAGYIKILIDRDGDGRADEAKQFAASPKTGAQGLWFHGRSLLCIGDGGLLRYRDNNADDIADGPPDVLLKVKTGGEHDVHSIQQGPDGWWYLIAGNLAGVSSRYATTSSSPVKSPRAGTIFRLKPDLSGGEIVAHGIRNAYDFAFNTQGDLFTYDSDEEREVSLPWYRPTRAIHVHMAADLGWVSKSWMRPDHYFDMPHTVASFGRGSPTGVACYRHTQFPDKYRGNLFICDWTYGRVHSLPLKVSNDTWSGEPELFISGTGQNGFAPTDIEVGPDGSLFVCIGGRGTLGRVYCIRHTLGHKLLPKSPQLMGSVIEKLAFILNSPQPLSAWSRSKWMPVAREIGDSPIRDVLRREDSSITAKIRSIEILTELFGGLTAEDLNLLIDCPAPEVRARAIWSSGRSTSNQTVDSLTARYIDDPSPQVGRCALESVLNRDTSKIEWPLLISPLAKRLGGTDRINRLLASKIVGRMDEKTITLLTKETGRLGLRAIVSQSFGLAERSSVPTQNVQGILPTLAATVLERKDATLDLRMDAVRLLQIALGDLGPSASHAPVFDGYSSQTNLEHLERELDPLRVRLAANFPSGNENIDRELIRLIAMLTPYNSKLVDTLCDKLTEESSPIDDIHHLAVVARLPMTHSVKQRDQLVKSLVSLDAKITSRHLPQDASWSDRIKEIWVKMALADDFLAAALVNHPDFGRPGHTIFLNQMPPELLPAARNAFLRQIEKDPNYAWTTEVVFAIGESGEESHINIIRSQFDRFTIRGSVLVILSRNPSGIDRPKFVAGLDWSQTEVMTACLTALEKLGPTETPEEQLALLKTLRRLGADDVEYGAREIVVQLLERNNGQKFPFVSGKQGYQPQPDTVSKWTEWCQKKWPGPCAEMLGETNSEYSNLKEILSKIDWNKGSPERGASLFTKRSCGQCHGSIDAIGPALTGVTNRFSTEDLFTAIVLPSRDVSARYQTTTAQTKDGKTYSGLIVYESIDGFILRTGTGQTFRIESQNIEERRKSPVSLMPAGLLRDLKPDDYADLYAYLKTLASAPEDAKKTRSP